MTTETTSFTLNPEYTNFEPGVSKVKLPDGGGCFLLIALMGMAMLVFMGASVYFILIEPHLMATYSEVTTGQVTKCTMVENKQGDFLPQVTYTYTWNNAQFESQDKISKRDQECATYQGQPIVVYVLGLNASVSQLNVPREPSTLWIGLVSFLFLLMLWGTIMFLRMFRRMRSSKRMYERLNATGNLLKGTVVSTRYQIDAKSKNFYVFVLYEFQTPSGEMLKGFGHTHRQDLQEVGLPVSGTPVTVLYADDEAYTIL